MKKSHLIASWCIVLLLIGGFASLFFLRPNSSTPAGQGQEQSFRQTIDIPLLAEEEQSPQTIPGNKLPKFTFDVSESKFQELRASGQSKIKEYAEASIDYMGADKNPPMVETVVSLNQEKHELVVRPKDMPNFRPGKYKLHLTLRTLEGEVDIDQDFNWGVIAVNTNKSIYKPGDVATIGMGVLNDRGETQCKTGENAAKVWLKVADPNGKVKAYSTEDGGINDSGKCGPITVTNEADFVSVYLIDEPGIYQMEVTAEVNGSKRTIKDYFKVQEDVAFDIERTSFPTRIYPKAQYKVYFNVTPKEDYNGNIEEFIPEEFQADSISDGGKIETVNGMKKIKWNVKLKKGQSKKFSYIITFPPVSPEFYLLGPITISSFKEARQWQIASDAINSTSGLVTYEDNNGSNTFSRVWTGTTWNPAIGSGGTNIDPNAGGADDFPDDSRWFVEKSSPKTGEKLVAAYDNCGTPINDVCLWMYRWTGTAWAEEDFVFDVDSGTAMLTDYRIMDIAYEEESGEALFVWGDNTNQLKYRVRTGGSWSGTLNAGTALDSPKKWVKAKAQFDSDTILVGYINDSERIGALIWDGSTNTFGNQFDDDDSPAQTETITSDEEAFDIAWETQSGTPMIFWGTAANTVLAREYTGGAWSTTETTVYNSGFAGDVEWITASSDPRPTSDYIALAMQESNSNTTIEVSDCEFGMWDGSAGVTRPTAISCRSDYNGRLNTVQFENDTGKAVWVYVPSESGTTGNSMGYRTWQNGVFSSGTTTAGDTNGNIESIQLHSDLNSTSMIALYVADSSDADSDLDLYHREWDGTSWSALGTSLYGRIQGGTNENAEAYGFGFDRNVETMAAYRWFENNNGTSVVTALASQDNPYTLTTANQQFRLRLLLYYPDSLAINGRDYKLQFVDIGSGNCASPSAGTPATWTDVGAPGSGTQISYYNNVSPADGDNLTANGGDPTYSPYTKVNQDYEEGTAVTNPLYFTNSVSAMSADQVGLWDFSLVDNTTFDVNPQTFCFRVIRSNGIVLQIDKYPQISTASINDVLINSGTIIQSGSLLQ